MNAPFFPSSARLRLLDLADTAQALRLEHFVDAHPLGTPFHRPAWLEAVARGTGNPALALVAETGDMIEAFLPLNEIHSPIFGKILASSGFAVGGGVLAREGFDPAPVFGALEELAMRRSCPSIELRGGAMPALRSGWTVQRSLHCGFVSRIEPDDDAQLLAIPRKQRAEVRKGQASDLVIRVGTNAQDRAAHYQVYAASVRNLGTPVFPRALFDAVLDTFASHADILTVFHKGAPVASVLSLYHGGAVMPYWGGGTREARHLRANDRMYFELMRHARARGCSHFDFGRSKTGSGAHDFKRNWGFEPEPLSYAAWTAPGAKPRDANPASDRHAARIAVWKRLPLALANRIGPMIARGLG